MRFVFIYLPFCSSLLPLMQMLEDVDRRFDSTVEQCQFCIRRLRRKFNIKSNRPCVRNLKAHLAGEKGEYFPVVVVLQ